MQVALAAAVCEKPEEALVYTELWCASITGSCEVPSQAQSAEHYGSPDVSEASSSKRTADPNVKSNAIASAWAAGASGLKPHEAVLWSAYKAIGDSDLAHGMAGAPSVRA